MGARDLFDDLKTGGWATVQEWIRNEQAESLHLDFKTRDHAARDAELEARDKSILGKAMSGFANVEGGVLVFGLATKRRGKGDPDTLETTQNRYLGDAKAFKKAVEKHFKSMTTPPVPGVEIVEILNPADGKQGIVLLRIPQSEAKPHRVADGIKEHGGDYFQRTHTDTIPMQHDMLGALFGRIPAPRLRLIAKWTENNKPPQLMLYLFNDGPGTGTQPVVRLVADPQHQALTIQGMTPGINRVSGQASSHYLLQPHEPVPMYSGFEEYLSGTLTVARTYDDQPRTIHLQGTIFSVGAAPVHFDEVVTFAGHEDIVTLPRS